MIQVTADYRQAIDRDQLADWLEAVARRRDRDAFARLFGYFAPRVKGFLMKRGVDGAMAEEIVQDVMLTVWRKADLFDRRQSSPSTWLFVVARNRHIDLVRRARRPDIDPDDPFLVPEPEPAPDETMAMVQREARLHRAIADLPAEQVDLLQLAFFQGKSHREIAAETGIALGTVKSRLRLAFARLRQALDGEI